MHLKQLNRNFYGSHVKSSNGVDELIQTGRSDGDKPVDGCSIGNVTNEYIGKLENVLTIVSIIIVVLSFITMFIGCCIEIARIMNV
jgi:hypothetical protein